MASMMNFEELPVSGQTVSLTAEYLIKEEGVKAQVVEVTSQRLFIAPIWWENEFEINYN